ncbi:MAG: hypothetical protein IIA07_00955 [Proteobacteria bacterium]|nr:hypothetical protein [Pseudomonadota bacterium]
MKDTEDRLLESMFQSEPIADNGFSDSVMWRLRRRIWICRLTLPAAILIGGAIAIKPALQFVLVGSRLLNAVPQELFAVPAAWISQLPIILIAATALVIGMLSVRMLDE